MTLRRALAALTAASLCSGLVDARGRDGQGAGQGDLSLATALTARDTAQAVRLAGQALSAPLVLPEGHAAAAMLGAGLRAALPTLLGTTPPGPVSSAQLNNLGVALALRGWHESAAVAFSGSLLVEQPRTAGRPWGSGANTTQRFQYSSSTPNPVVVNIENLARVQKTGQDSSMYGGRGPYELFNGLLETAERRPSPNERLRAMAEVFPPVVSRALADALTAPAAGAPATPWSFGRAYRSFAQYKGKYLRSLDGRHRQRIATAASQSDRWDDRGLYGFDPATRLRAGEVFVDLYLVDLGDSPATMRREYVAVVVAVPPAATASAAEPRVLSLGPAATVDNAVDDLWADLGPSGAPKAFEALAARVWTPLVKAFPAGTRRVWLSPDGRLGPVPWQALALTGSRQSQVTVSIVDSGETIRERRPRPATPSARVVLAGNPEYGSQPGARFPPLRHTADEIRAVEEVVRSSGLQADVLTGAIVDRPRLLKSMPARIVHIATHGEFRDAPFRAPMYSVGPWLVLDPELRASAAASPVSAAGGAGIDFAEMQRQMAALAEEAIRTGRQASNEQLRAAVERARGASTSQALAPLAQGVLALSGANGVADPFAAGSAAFLSDVDFAASDLSSTDLVVLPACNLGGSSQSAFQGLMSMQGAVVLAGARGLVASLWPVSDAEAVPFMRQFYANLLQRKLPPAEALLEAQRTASVDAAGRPRPPFLWAGWTFFGEGW